MGDDSITRNSEEELESTYCSQVMLLTMIAIRGIWLCHLKCKLFKNKENLKIKCLPVTFQILNSYIHLVVGALGRVENICIVTENYIRQCCLQRKARGDIYLGVSFQSQGKPLLSHIIAFIHLFSPSIFPTFHWIYLAENQGRFCGKQYFRKVSKISTTGVCIQCNHPTLECRCCAVFSLSVLSDSLQLRGLQPTRLLCPRGFSRQEYWSGLLHPPPGDLPNPGIKPASPSSPALQAGSLPLSHWGSLGNKPVSWTETLGENLSPGTCDLSSLEGGASMPLPSLTGSATRPLEPNTKLRYF